MKKNVLTIIILALGLLNMILTAIIMFAVVPTTIRTNDLIAKVASSIDLELKTPLEKEKENDVSIENIEVYQIPDDLVINLKKGDDGKNHYASVSVSFSINKKSEDYKTLEPTVETNVSKITEIITDEFSKYTMDTVTNSKETIKANILKKVQGYFNSDFIFSVTLGKIVVE